MGIRAKFFEWLSRGEPDDPDELVEIARVRVAGGPLLVAGLCNAGFRATGEEAFNVVTRTTSDYRILVPRGEANDAMAHLSATAAG